MLNKSMQRCFTCLLIVIMGSILCLFSCKQARDIPFSPGTPVFSQPVSKAFRLPAAQAAHWTSGPGDTIVLPPASPFDLETIPAEPFYIDGFTPFPVIPAVEKTNWLTVTPTAFRLDTVPVKPLTYTKVPVQAPEHFAAGVAKSKAPVTKNILQLGREEGLPGGVVHAMYQDKQGIYWIATGQGLCRYDGAWFEVYHFISKEPQGNIHVHSIQEDDLGRLWIRTESRGSYVFDYARQTALNIDIAAYDLALDSSQHAWLVGTNGIIYRINTKGLSVQQFSARRVADSGNVARIFPGAGGQVFFRSEAGLSVLNLKEQQLRQWHCPPPADVNSLFYGYRKKDGTILCASPQGLDALDPTTGLVQHFTTAQGLLAAPSPYEAIEDNQGRIWQSRGDSGIEVIDSKAGTIWHLNKNGGLSENGVSTIAEDNKGRIWLGTETGGINSIDMRFPVNHLSEQQGLASNSVWGLAADGAGNIWLGTTKGVDVINVKKHTIRHLNHAIGIDPSQRSLSKILQDKQGRIWISGIASKGGSLSLIDPKAKTIRRFDKINYSFANALGLKTDARGRIWINGYGKGVALFDPATGIIRHLNAAGGLAGNLPWRLLVASDGRVWVATSRGLSIIAADTASVINLHSTDGLSDNVTQSLAEDSTGAVWVSTNEGLDRLDLAANNITRFSKTEGMRENESFALEATGGKIYAGTSSGISVIGRDSGRAGQWNVSGFARPDGFYFMDVNSNTSLVSPDHQLWWGIQQVVTVMDIPGTDTIVPVAHISGIAVNGQRRYFAPDTSITGLYWDTTEGLFRRPAQLSLSHQYNQISFEFTAMAPADGGNTRYSYILEGLDDAWSAETTTAQSPAYNNLSPGDYRFSVRSRDRKGRWSAADSLSFSILPPWWQRWWAWGLYILGFVLLLRGYIAYRSAALRKENELLEQKVADRTGELSQSLSALKAAQSQLIHAEKMASLGELTAGIAHEIQNPLNFVNNFSEVNTELAAELQTEIERGNLADAKDIAGDIQANAAKILQHGRRADGIVKGMLQHSSNNSGTKEPSNINQLLDEWLRLAYHGTRAKDNGFNAVLQTDYDQSIGMVSLVPQAIGRVVLNLINNALYAVQDKKRTADTGYMPSILVRSRREADHLRIDVADNGNGIAQHNLNKIFQPFFTTKPTGQGTGLGLSLSYDIVKAQGGNLSAENQPEHAEGWTGAWFTIVLPLS